MTLSMDKIQETLSLIFNDSALILIVGISIVILLVIVLVVVVSTMRVRGYKNRFLSVELDNQIKAEHILHIEKELEKYKIKNASNEQELQQFEETKNRLNSSNESFLALQSRFYELEKELSQIDAKLEAVENIYATLQEKHKQLEKRHNEVVEASSKYRITNARLLTKLEMYERSS